MPQGIPSTKVFKGKRYERVGSYATKREAEASAKVKRERGHLARISKWTSVFGKIYFLLFVKYRGQGR